METNLLSTIVLSLVAAFVLGFVARRLGLPPLVGYLVAGVAVGPYTPGFVADLSIAKQLAEIGIILLMFGVGLHFSIKDLTAVRRLALPGALFQMAVATGVGAALAVAMGYGGVEGALFGFSLSVASTVVLLRAFEERNAIATPTGKIAVGWLIVEDIAMVFALVLLPVVADMAAGGTPLDARSLAGEFLGVAFKLLGFAVLMVVVGRRVLPWLLNALARIDSRELLSLGTLAIALGFAYLAYTVFDASFALGAFLAGLVLSESDTGYRAAEQSLPLRDAFSVLFFVSVGMLFNPATLVTAPVGVLLTLAIIVVGKGAAALVIARLFGQQPKAARTIALSLAQIGEFSFIFGGLAVSKNLLDPHLYNLIIAGALLSIALNPVLFRLARKHLDV